MHELLYFVHVTALTVWVGSLIATAWVSRAALRAPEAGSRTWALDLVNRLTLRVVVPASVLVLLAGVSMAALSGRGGAPKPLWLTIMEDIGGGMLILSLFVIPWLSRRIRRAAEDKEAVGKAVRAYVAGLFTLAAGVAGVLLAVSFRLA